MKRLLTDKTIYKYHTPIIKNPYVLYILNRYLFIHIDIIEMIADIDIENLVSILSLDSIKDIKNYEYN
tara:strand:- start:6644 stop:6847 length:204 start_codon:yes stop_codon:yes gene_type:complete